MKGMVSGRVNVILFCGYEHQHGHRIVFIGKGDTYHFQTLSARDSNMDHCYINISEHRVCLVINSTLESGSAFSGDTTSGTKCCCTAGYHQGVFATTPKFALGLSSSLKSYFAIEF